MKKHICIDVENANEILAYINRDERHKKKFNYIIALILSNKKISELYDKEDISDNCKAVTAMKFFKGQENDRLYCKELRGRNGTFYIVTAELLEKKKDTKVRNGKTKNIITKVASYEYEIIRPENTESEL
ncbi:hypothetical protein [Chitinophaga japonensis]|uniref:Phage derived Gp49-like protein DUF891 n=1 Tax=Chitinophaga japonensis TaxID=104662 RepID=A0A562ST40_CHIJA|nr:hypothetical protein [Chitinophaga japonensis]TWI84268.1 hypothetical protein LX66_4632 [Chitinophaga japonensis]